MGALGGSGGGHAKRGRGAEEAGQASEQGGAERTPEEEVSTGRDDGSRQHFLNVAALFLTLCFF